MFNLRSLALVVAVLSLVSLASGCPRKDDPSSSQRSSASQSSQSKEPNSSSTSDSTSGEPKKVDFSLNLEDLFKEFEADREAAAKKYGGKIMEIEGVVEDPHLGHPSNDPYMAFWDSKQQANLFCFVTKSDGPRTYQLTKGQKLKVRGELNTEQYKGSSHPSLYLMQSQIVEAGPDPAMPISAADLAKAYAQDETTAGERFKDKQLLIDGVVKDVTKVGADKNMSAIVLEGSTSNGGKSLCVWATANFYREKDFESIRKGQKVKLKGPCKYVDGKNQIGEDGVFIAGAVLVP
jgi:hypothetical protein